MIYLKDYPEETVVHVRALRETLIGVVDEHQAETPMRLEAIASLFASLAGEVVAKMDNVAEGPKLDRASATKFLMANVVAGMGMSDIAMNLLQDIHADDKAKSHVN